MFKRIQFALAAVPVAMMMGIAFPASADVAGFWLCSPLAAMGTSRDEGH